MIEVAVFGAGRIGSIHAGNVAAIEGVNLACVVDPNAAAAEALAARLGATVATTG
jgi:myo-inositol 2-dehydrogenase/D-chiro-inositol 1-dehydrogenase